MIRHILKDGTVTTDITGHLVKRKDCPEAYAAMERMTTNDNIRQTDGRETARPEISHQGKKGKVRNNEKKSDSVR